MVEKELGGLATMLRGKVKIKIKIKIKNGLGLHTTSGIYFVNNWMYGTRLPSPSSHLLRGCVASESSNK